MLVLSRKLNESIQIGDDITITLIRVEGGKVRLGIDAPRDVRVLRSELEAHHDKGATSKKGRGSKALESRERTSTLDTTLIGENELDLESMKRENEAAQISEREQAFAHPVLIPNRSKAGSQSTGIQADGIQADGLSVSPRRREPINRFSNLTAPHVSLERVKIRNGRAPLAAFLQ
ncbi:hypothetical protein Q31b_09530 [Novipirellula aureliae]|uniref:Translational regulator CsrA n=1 Tax=Novipirellula aureliae TaxID=2527966 RepID=A0A5C6ECU0_9BACT|nr:hypothetical protein Q31b_09530 [Novipirellula aureliae]